MLLRTFHLYASVVHSPTDVGQAGTDRPFCVSLVQKTELDMTESTTPAYFSTTFGKCTCQAPAREENLELGVCVCGGGGACFGEKDFYGEKVEREEAERAPS